MHSNFSHFAVLKRVCHVVAFALWIVLLVGTADAQRSSTDGYTPMALQPGAPAGSYALSDFDHVNLYNGNLNFSLPLRRVVGRGEAQYMMALMIEQHWLERHF